MKTPETINDYLRCWAPELGERIIAAYPPLHSPSDASSPIIGTLRRRPYPAQELAILGVVKRWRQARTAAVIAECGTGKTLIAFGAAHVHSEGSPYTAIAMVPPQLVQKTAREAFLTLPLVRVFVIDGLRNVANANGPAGVNEVRLRDGRVVREGLHTTLSDLRLRKTARSARARWNAICPMPALFIVGRDRAKLGYFWRHAYQVAKCGPYSGSVVNPDTGNPIRLDDNRLLKMDFKNARLSELVGNGNGVEEIVNVRREFYSPLWQADGEKIHRFAPIEFVGRYLNEFFDYGIADEAHEMKGDTAQGNALGTMASCVDRIVILTGTLLGGYAADLFNILFRLEAGKMIAEGFEWGEAGIRQFTETYGVLEKVTIIEEDNACSKSRITKRVKQKPGASPLLFGRFLMSLGAFVSLEDISSALPPYHEEVIGVPMDPPMRAAYRNLEDAVKAAIKEHHGNNSVLSTALNALLLYPDRPFGLGRLYGWEYNPETQSRERFLIAETEDLDESVVYAKERRLIEDVKSELAQGRRCQVYAVYTQKRDVTRRLESILAREGIRVALLTTDVKPETRESWYERRLREGVQVVISHPKLVQTGLDLLSFETLYFFETGYSIFTLRQAGRRSWRIGQRNEVRVKYLYYLDTLQAACLRLMGKKLLVALAMEGKFSTEGLQAMDEDDDMLMTMARELVTDKNVGETADQIWRSVQEQHQVTTGVRPAELPVPAASAVPAVVQPSDAILPPARMPLVQLALFD